MLNGMKSFGAINFGNAELGDKRRTTRLVRSVDSMCRRAGGTLPQKLQAPKDLRGAYRLFQCDQGADTFEFLEHEMKSNRRFVIRSAHSRGAFPGHKGSGHKEHGERTLLRDYVREFEAAGHWTLQVSSKSERKSPKKKGEKKLVQRIKREANMAVSFAPVRISPPVEKTGNHGNAPLPIWVIRVWEVDPPQGQERLEWFLLTNHQVNTFVCVDCGGIRRLANSPRLIRAARSRVLGSGMFTSETFFYYG